MVINPKNAPRRFLSLSPEADLLFASVSAPWRADMRERAARLADLSLDWGLVCRLSQYWDIEPLLFETLRQISHPGVPPRRLEALEAAYNANGMRSLSLTKECVRLYRLMVENGIQCAPYKGPFLASGLYRNLALRCISDLDYLVPRRQIPQAVGLLQAQGYRLNNNGKPDNPEQLLKNKTAYVVTMLRNSPRVAVELHWDVLPPATLFDLDQDFYWEWLRPSQCLGLEVPMFAPEEQFFLLCLHNEKHSWHSPRFILDVIRIMDCNPGLDWPRIRQLAERWRRCLGIDMTLRVIQDIFGLPVPSEAWTERCEPARLAQRAAMIRARLFRHPYGYPPYAEWIACQARSGERATGFIGYMRSLMASEHDDHMHFSPWIRRWPSLYSLVRIFAKYHFYRRFLPSRRLYGFEDWPMVESETQASP